MHFNLYNPILIASTILFYPGLEIKHASGKLNAETLDKRLKKTRLISFLDTHFFRLFQRYLKNKKFNTSKGRFKGFCISFFIIFFYFFLLQNFLLDDIENMKCIFMCYLNLSSKYVFEIKNDY